MEGRPMAEAKLTATDISYQHGYFDGHGDGSRRAAKTARRKILAVALALENAATQPALVAELREAAVFLDEGGAE